MQLNPLSMPTTAAVDALMPTVTESLAPMLMSGMPVDELDDHNDTQMHVSMPKVGWHKAGISLYRQHAILYDEALATRQQIHADMKNT